MSRVLKRLHVLAGSETPSAEDDAAADTVIEDVHEELQELGLAYWALSAIPAAVVPGLVHVICADLAGDFLTDAEAASYEGKRNYGLARIRAAVSNLKEHEINPQNYF